MAIISRDQNGQVIQTLAPDGSTTAKSALTSGSVAVALPSGAEFVEIASTGNFHFLFGVSATVDTNDSLFPAGSAIYRVPDGATHLSHIRADAASDALPITITKMI
jgi:hypothetical protein